MSGKRNNRLLLGVFLVLAALYVITRFTSRKQSDRSLRTEIVRIDSSQVSSIQLYPASEQGTLLSFSRKGSSWTVEKEGVTAAADEGSVKRMLGELMNLKTEQLISRSPERWSLYQVDDSLGSRVVIMEGKTKALDLMVGRFNYQAPPSNSYNPYGQNRASGSTYVRVSDEAEVYTVEGFLAMTINQPFEQWRNQTLTSLTSSQLSRIVFSYPADSGFVAEKTEAGWMVAGMLADSASMVQYLNEVSHLNRRDFLRGDPPGGEADYTISFEGDNIQAQQLRAYLLGNEQLALNSSVNPETWFSLVRTDDLYDDLFPSPELLISGGN